MKIINVPGCHENRVDKGNGDLQAILNQGIRSLDEVEIMVLGTDGSTSVIKN
ncbi:DUF421 domain-containing protein [Planococcus lenghuensis]|uniref:hypothetical protein n=1 Tax=Planococcus lenghuensis TaxID=2213202 RepID=UPI0012EBEBF0|nr:hypothetical protein [Planococcus lenghuensis]